MASSKRIAAIRKRELKKQIKLAQAGTKSHSPNLRPRWTPFRHLGKRATTCQINGGEIQEDQCEVFVNSRYQVAKFDDGDIIHLSIKRLDLQPLQDWRELQRIKNELLGEEVEAVQLHPAESRLLDMCDQVHLWALKEGRFSFGFQERIVSEGTLLPGQTQRPFEHKPADLVRMESVMMTL